MNGRRSIYKNDHAEPALVFVTHGAWRDETDVVIRATAADDGIVLLFFEKDWTCLTLNYG